MHISDSKDNNSQASTESAPTKQHSPPYTSLHDDNTAIKSISVRPFRVVGATPLSFCLCRFSQQSIHIVGCGGPVPASFGCIYTVFSRSKPLGLIKSRHSFLL